MAKAGLETAIWDLYAKKVDRPLWKLIDGVRSEIPSGVVVGTHEIRDALLQIDSYLQEGYKE